MKKWQPQNWLPHRTECSPTYCLSVIKPKVPHWGHARTAQKLWGPLSNVSSCRLRKSSRWPGPIASGTHADISTSSEDKLRSKSVGEYMFWVASLFFVSDFIRSSLGG